MIKYIQAADKRGDCSIRLEDGVVLHRKKGITEWENRLLL